MKKAIKIREFSKQLTFYLVLLFVSITYIVCDLFTLLGIKDLSGYLLDSFDFLFYIFVLFFFPITYWFLRDEGQFFITDTYIDAIIPLRRCKCRVYLSKPVYYSIYRSVGDGTVCILISNNRFSLETARNSGINYCTQIEIPYRKKLRLLIPKENWIKIEK